MWLQHRTDLRSRAMQEHPLIAVGHSERLANLLGAATLHVAQHDHLSLRGRQRIDGAFRQLYRLLEQELLVRPSFRRGAPGSWPARVVGWIEPPRNPGGVPLRRLA